MKSRSNSPRRPDYIIGLMNKKTDVKNGNVGAAWVSDDGTISIVFNNFIAIPCWDRDEHVCTLFPTEDSKE